jgi:hypothetical protein
MKKLLYIVAILAIASISCVKKEYDLNKELDLNVKLGNSFYAPLAETTRLYLKNFLDTNKVDILTIYNDGYAIVIDSSLNIDVPEIDEFEAFSIDPVNENIHINFADFSGFPDLIFDFGILDEPINSGFFTTNSSALAALSSMGTVPVETVVSTLSGFGINIQPSAREEYMTPVNIPIKNVLADNQYVSKVDAVWLTHTSEFHITVDVSNVPSGLILILDTLRLEFPSQINLNTNHAGVVSNHVFNTTHIPITAAGLNLSIPIQSLTNIYDETSGEIAFSGDVNVIVKYTLSGSIHGSSFPSSSAEAPSLHLDVTPKLAFESATITLKPDALADVGSFREKIDFDFHETISNDITINGVDSVVFKNSQITLNLDLQQSGGNILDNLSIDLDIDFPNDLMISSQTGTWKPGNKFSENITFVGGKKNLAFNLHGMKFPNPIINNTINILDSIVISTSVSLINRTINTKDIEGIDLRLTAVGGGHVDFSKVYANITYDIPMDDHISVDLSDLPPIIMDHRDSLILDVNPYLDLVLETNLQIPFGANVVLTPYKDGNPIDETILEIPVEIDPTKGPLTKLWIAKNGTSTPPAGQGYTVINKDLGLVVREIFPDSIVIKMDGGIDKKNAMFDFAVPYYANMDYKFVVPFEFGDQFQIVITETIDSLQSIIGDVLNGNKITLVIQTENTIPLDLEATIIPIDSNNNPIQNVDPAKFIIKAHATLNQEPARVIFDDSKNKGNGLINMRGVILEFRATAKGVTGDRILSPEDYIKVILQAEVHGGIVIDLRDL